MDSTDTETSDVMTPATPKGPSAAAQRQQVADSLNPVTRHVPALCLVALAIQIFVQLNLLWMGLSIHLCCFE